MKRLLILVVIALLGAGILVAEEAVLIDFSLLTADAESEDDNVPPQNEATMLDYASVAGPNYTDDQKAVMKTSLAIENWDVVLASSARNVTNQRLSYTKEAPSGKHGTVMGVRIHFPLESHNSWARVKPPFDIPAFEAAGDEEEGDGITGPSKFENGLGVIKNVGNIKAIQVSAYGLNFPHYLSVILIDNQGTEKIIPMGYLNFDQWGELRWDNPTYIKEVRNRELRLYPLYPQATPFVKFGGFLIQRDAANLGGDFIVYFKDVKVIYDKAVLDTERDIADESLWNIVRDRESAKKSYELRQFGHKQVLRYLENQKQATEDTFTPAEEE